MTTRVQNECHTTPARSPRGPQAEIAPTRNGSDTEDFRTPHPAAETGRSVCRPTMPFTCPQAVDKSGLGGEWHRTAAQRGRGLRKRISGDFRAGCSEATWLPRGNVGTRPRRTRAAMVAVGGTGGAA